MNLGCNLSGKCYSPPSFLSRKTLCSHLIIEFRSLGFVVGFFCSFWVCFFFMVSFRPNSGFFLKVKPSFFEEDAVTS